MNRFLLILALSLCFLIMTFASSYALTFVSQTSTPQKTDGTLGTITVVATGTGTVEYRKGLFGTWTTSGYFTNLTTGNYIIYARDGLVTKPISTSVAVDYIVHIPDANFKNYLVNNATLNTNADSEIQVTEADAYTQPINAGSLGISDMTGLEWFPNIGNLNCANNTLTTLDLSGNLLLTLLLCNDNLLAELDLSAHTNFNYLQCQNNSLTTLNIKNGNNLNQIFFRAYNNSLTCITVDDPDYSRENWTEIDPGVAFSLDCADPAPVITDVEVTHIEGCYGDSTGTINIVASEGEGALAYSIDSGATWQASASFENLPAGTYTIQVKDANAYLVKWELNPEELTQPEELVIDNAATTNDDGTGTGSITVTASGGTPPYMYRIDDSDWQASNLFESLAVGIYWVYVSDNNLCIDSTEATITEPLVDIPNAIFKAYLVGNSKINTDGDPEIQVREAEAFTDTIDVDGLGIDDLTGIEAFVNLTNLFCNNNLLSSIDVSNNTLLNRLTCTDNSLTTLDVSNNPNITRLWCTRNIIETLDLSNNPLISSLNCSENELTYLDLSNNPLLSSLSCGNNHFTEIDISQNPLLTSIICVYNQLEMLDVSFQPELRQLRCENNNLTTLDVSGNPNLSWLDFSYNQITGIDLSNNPALQRFNCLNNFLTVLDLSKNTALTNLQCANNPITTLDLSKNTLLANIICHNMSLTDLNLQNGNNNNISIIDFTDNPGLTCVSVDDVVYSETNWSTFFDAGVTFSLNCHPDLLVIDQVVTTDVNGCFGDANGQIVVSASGGTGSLRYSIDNGVSYQASDTFSNLPSGSYQVVVKDDDGDSLIWADNPVVVNEPGELRFSVSSGNPSCNGFTDGEIRFVSVSGGTGTLYYSIDGGETWGTLATFTDLGPGSYDLRIKDSNDCEKEYSHNPRILTDPLPFVVTNVVTTNHTFCNGEGNGSIRIYTGTGVTSLKSVEGTAPEYDYSIDDGETWQHNNPLFTGLMSGSYPVWARNENGCLDEWDDNPVELESINPVTIVSIEVTDDNGSSSGRIQGTVTGGEVPYQYRLDEGAWQASNLFTDLAAGTYLLEVTDQYSCSDSEEVIVADASVPEHDTIRGTNFVEDDSLCFGALLTIVVGGDAEDDSVDFEIGSFTRLIAGQAITFLPGVHIHAGSFLNARITTDGTFCDEEVESTVALAETPVKSIGERENTDDRPVPGSLPESCSMKVYPNPNNGFFNLELTGFMNRVHVGVYNPQGAMVLQFITSENFNSIDLYGLKPGVYFLKAMSPSACLSQKLVIR